MLWGPMFGATHIISLIVAVLINVGLYFLLKNKSRKVQIGVLFVLSFAGFVAIGYNLFHAEAWGQSPLEYLPLHLCSLNAILLPFAVASRKKWCCNLLLLWSLGAYVALIMNRPNYEIFSGVFAVYFFPHALEAGIPILLFVLDLVDRDYRCIKSTLAITGASYVAIHIINLFINSLNLVNPSGEIIKVNYMFSVTPDNPLLALFYSIIPHQFWYMLLAVPIMLLYLSWLYLPELFAARRRRIALKKKLDVVDEYYDEYEEKYTKNIIDKD